MLNNESFKESIVDLLGNFSAHYSVSISDGIHDDLNVLCNYRIICDDITLPLMAPTNNNSNNNNNGNNNNNNNNGNNSMTTAFRIIDPSSIHD